MEAVVVLHPLSPQVCCAPTPGSKPLRSAGEGKHSTQGKAFRDPGFPHHSQTPSLGLEPGGTDRPLLPSHGGCDGLVTLLKPACNAGKAVGRCRSSPWGGISLAEHHDESRMGPPMMLEVLWIFPPPPQRSAAVSLEHVTASWLQ